MSSNIKNTSATNRRNIKNYGRRIAGSYGRVTHKLRSVANRAVRHAGKIIVREYTLEKCHE